MQSSPFQTTLNVVLSIIVSLIIGSMQMGKRMGAIWICWTVRHFRRAICSNRLKNQFFKTLGVLALQAIYVILWSVLLIIPGIMKLYRLGIIELHLFR